MRETDTADRPGSRSRLFWDGNGAPETFPQAISRALEELRNPVELGGIGIVRLCRCFDGREGETVAESTVSRWIAEPGRFPAVFLPVLVEMDAPFRGQVFSMLAARAASPEAVMQRISPEARAEVGRAYEQLIVEEIGPGKWGRR